MAAPLPMASLLLLAASSNNSFTPSFPGGFIAWAVCYARRRQEIGGVLMFFYWQLYGGLLITLVMLGLNFRDYVPESFRDAGLYHLFLISALPPLISYSALLIVATLALSVRTWDMLVLVRNVLIAETLCALLGFAVDVRFFHDNLFFDGYTIVTNTVWIAYFLRSKRVVHVFKQHDWSTVVDAMHPLKVAKTA